MTSTATAEALLPTTARPIVYVIPCAAAKVDHAAPARDLYTSANFRSALATAEAMAAADGGTVLILSAKYGLLELDTVVDTYDVKMGDADAITPEGIRNTAVELGLDEADPELYALLPAAYFTALAQALAPLYLFAADVYEAAPGIGYQRGAVRSCREFYATA